MSVTRRALRGVVLALGGLGVALAAPASASAQAKAGVNTTPPAAWSLRLSADGSWYENAYFDGAADTQWSTSGQMTLSHVRRFRTGSFSIAGFGGAIYYPEADDLNQPVYGGSLGLGWAPSRRTKLSLGQSYQHSSTRYQTALDSEGLPLPTSAYDNAATTLGLDRQLSQRWQLSLQGTYVYRLYDDDRLEGGKEASGTLQLGHQVGRHASVYVAYGHTSSWIDGGRWRSHQALVGARRQPGQGASFELAGGVGYVESTGAWYPSGRAGLTLSGRRTSFGLAYYRDFGQAFGYGRQAIGDIGSANLSWAPGRNASFNASYNLAYRRDPADESYTILSSVAGVGFDWRIGGGVGFGASYAWERNETEGLPVVEGGRASAALSYGVEWK